MLGLVLYYYILLRFNHNILKIAKITKTSYFIYDTIPYTWVFDVVTPHGIIIFNNPNANNNYRINIKWHELIYLSLQIGEIAYLK